MFNYFKLTRKAHFISREEAKARGLRGGWGDGGHGSFGGSSRKREPEPKKPDPPVTYSTTGYCLQPEKEVLLTRKDKYYVVYRNGKYYKCYGLKNKPNAQRVFNNNLSNKYMDENAKNKDLVIWVPNEKTNYYRITQAIYNKEAIITIPASGTYTLRLNDTTLDTKEKSSLQTKELRFNAGDTYKLPVAPDVNNINSLVFNITENGTAKGA